MAKNSVAKIIQHPLTKQRTTNIKKLKVLIDQYITSEKKEVINKIRAEQ